MTFHLETIPDDSAFGQNVIKTFGNPHDGTTAAASETRGGLTKREYFAGLAMQGLVANDNRFGQYADFANESIAYADALIEALNKGEKP